MNQVDAELIMIEYLDPKSVYDYWMEFYRNREADNVLFGFDPDDVGGYLSRQREDHRNHRFGFFTYGSSGKRLAGLLRLTSKVTYPANGMLGYSIRPSERGKGYAKELLKLAKSWGAWHGMIPLTACVDVRNEISIHCLKAVGFKETGVVYNWDPNPEPRKAVELLWAPEP